MKRCFMCGRYAYTERHHVIGGTANRKLSEKYGLVADLCPCCHRTGVNAVHKDAEAAQRLHEWGQRKFMREQNCDIAGFAKVFGRNYLDEEW